MSELGFYVSWSNKRDMWYVMPDNSFVGRMPDSTALVRGGYADGYYITDEERERVLRPAVACLQYILDVCEREQEDWAGPINYSSPEKYLIGGYYMLGELDMVKQTRAFWHQKTGSDWYNPDGYTTETNGNLVQYDESGRPYYANLNPSRGEREVWYEYDENGKLIKVTTEYVSYEDRTGYGTLTHVGSIIREYTYENGRLDHWTETVKDECREASEYSNGTVVNLYQYEYEGDTVTRLFYVDGTLSSTEKFRITEFGVYDYE